MKSYPQGQGPFVTLPPNTLQQSREGSEICSTNLSQFKGWGLSSMEEHLLCLQNVPGSIHGIPGMILSCCLQLWRELTVCADSADPDDPMLWLCIKQPSSFRAVVSYCDHRSPPHTGAIPCQRCCCSSQHKGVYFSSITLVILALVGERSGLPFLSPTRARMTSVVLLK